MDFMPTIDREEIPPLEFQPVFFDEVEKILTDMLAKVSFFHDAISNKKLKHISSIISLSLSHLINISIKDNYRLDLWKVAKIVLLYKSGDTTDTTNYRPISLLSSFSKVLEKAIYKQTYNNLNRKNLSQRSVRFPSRPFM
jgi:hypothetical protein